MSTATTATTAEVLAELDYSPAWEQWTAAAPTAAELHIDRFGAAYITEPLELTEWDLEY